MLHKLLQKVIFVSFQFHDFVFTRESCEDKNLVKISTYTVLYTHQVVHVSITLLNSVQFVE